MCATIPIQFLDNIRKKNYKKKFLFFFVFCASGFVLVQVVYI
jgi:hypothetical protein